MFSRRFKYRSRQEVRRATELWLDQQRPQYDPEFGLLLTSPQQAARWKTQLEPAATARGYHDPKLSLYYALALLITGRELNSVQAILSRSLKAQVRQKDSPRFGEFKLIYEVSGDKILDSNATFFCGLPLVCIEREYASLVDPDILEDIREALALVPHTVMAKEFKLGVYYTNRSLANLAVWFGVADMLQDHVFSEEIVDRFDYFYDQNMRRGIPERLSGGYYIIDLISLAMMWRYAPDSVRNRARELMNVLVQELLFFETRQPLPARRTYNETSGVATKWSVLDWLVNGSDDIGADECDYDGNLNLPNSAHDLPIADLYLREILEPELFALPPKRQMRGRFVDESGYTSYFHEHFTLGTFDAWPPLTIRDATKQYLDDMPVGFAGASGDLAYFGVYSIDASGHLHTHPGTGTVLFPFDESTLTAENALNRAKHPLHAGQLGSLIDSSEATLPTVTYLASQEANLCCVLTNASGGVRCLIKEYGWRVVGPTCKARLFDQQGHELVGEGDAKAQWLFLVTNDYFAAIYPLTRYAAEPSPKGFGHTPVQQNIRYSISDDTMSLFAPVFSSDPPDLILGDNWPAGAVFILDSAHGQSPEDFRQRIVTQAEVLDDWRLDGYLVRNGLRDAERSAGVRLPGAELKLTVDYRTGQVQRTFNGRPIDPPDSLSSIRFGVYPA